MKFTQYGLKLLSGVYVRHLLFNKCEMEISKITEDTIQNPAVDELTFENVKNLKSIFKEKLFWQMVSITNITFINSPVDLFNGMFTRYTYLKNVVIDNSIISIGIELFNTDITLISFSIINNDLKCEDLKKLKGLVSYVFLYSSGNNIHCSKDQLANLEIMTNVSCIVKPEIYITTTSPTTATEEQEPVTYNDNLESKSYEPQTYPMMGTQRAPTPPATDIWFSVFVVQSVVIVAMATVIYLGIFKNIKQTDIRTEACTPSVTTSKMAHNQLEKSDSMMYSTSMVTKP